VDHTLPYKEKDSDGTSIAPSYGLVEAARDFERDYMIDPFETNPTPSNTRKANVGADYGH
jgi:hypothetical protein